jgi:hypothetical protein
MSREGEGLLEAWKEEERCATEGKKQINKIKQGNGDK